MSQVLKWGQIIRVVLTWQVTYIAEFSHQLQQFPEVNTHTYKLLFTKSYHKVTHKIHKTFSIYRLLDISSHNGVRISLHTKSAAQLPHKSKALGCCAVGFSCNTPGTFLSLSLLSLSSKKSKADTTVPWSNFWCRTQEKQTSAVTKLLQGYLALSRQRKKKCGIVGGFGQMASFSIILNSAPASTTPASISVWSFSSNIVPVSLWLQEIEIKLQQTLK